MGTVRRESVDLQTVALDHAAACVRLLNLTGSVGCATPTAGVTVPLAAILSAVDLESLPAAVQAEPHAFLLAPELFTPAVVHRLQSALGSNLAGLLVLHAETQPGLVRVRVRARARARARVRVRARARVRVRVS